MDVRTTSNVEAARWFVAFKLATSPDWLARAVVALVEHNMVRDAHQPFYNSLVEWIGNGRTLTPKQAQAVRQTIYGYAERLVEIAQHGLYDEPPAGWGEPEPDFDRLYAEHMERRAELLFDAEYRGLPD